MKRFLSILVACLAFCLVEGCYLGGAVRRAVTGEPPDPGMDGATSGAKEALYVTTYAVLRELAGLASSYLGSKVKKRASDLPGPAGPAQ